jgi:outer membrane protein assembly factor BamD
MRIKIHSFFPSSRTSLLAGLAVAALLAGTTTLRAQDSSAPQPAAQTSGTPAQADVTLSNTTAPKKKSHIVKIERAKDTKPATAKQAAKPAAGTNAAGTSAAGTSDVAAGDKPAPKKSHIARAERIQPSKDTKVELKKEAKYNPLVGKDQQLPDKQLYDKAMTQVASGHYDIGRLDLQTLLDTYPDSQYMMRAKLAVADAWYKEGGSAAFTEAEQEYRDFVTFFPNVPEAAEAQLRIGDIYFKQMDVPDRDYSKATHAEQEYRTMLKQYPDAPKPILDESRQKLREVQEVLADRDAELGSFYATHGNWPASIARYQTVVDSYPLYSHMDDVLIGIGDAYEAEATMVRSRTVCTKTLPAGTPCIPEGAKARLLEDYDGKAAEDYRRVVVYHSAAFHVEDAKERLTGMNLPIPTPTKEEAALSEELENSRAQYNLQRRIQLFFMHSPNTVTTARVGLPTLDDPAPTLAPTVLKQLTTDYVDALNPNAGKAAPAPASAAEPTETAADAPAAPASTAPPTLEDVPSEGSGAVSGSDKTVTVVEPGTNTSTGRTGTSIGAEILTPGAGGEAPATGTPASDRPAATGAQDPNYGLPMPKATTALPPVEKAADAPDQVNDVAGQPVPQTPETPAAANGKKKKIKTPKVDKNDESSSKKKPKKGLDKLNPF